MDLENQLKEVHEKEEEILKEIKERNKKRKIQCKGCGDYHEIGNLEAIQVQYYVPPRGCNEGDYWNSGELQFICPETEVKNRILFDNTDVPWPKRNQLINNPEMQFHQNYKPLFQKVTKIEEEENRGNCVNNWYVDKNRAEFGIVEKRR